MEKIYVPQVNANDNTYVLQKYYVSEKQEIAAGSMVAAISSSKSAVDVTAGSAGLIHLAAKEQEEVTMGDVLALVFENDEEYRKYLSGEGKKTAGDSERKYTITRLAREFAEENHFSEAELLSLNKNLIKKTDLEGLLKNRAVKSVNSKPLSRFQKSVAKTVTESWQTVPRAFELVKVDCTKAQRRLMELGREFSSIISYGEVLTVILKEISQEFPVFFSHLTADYELVLPEEPNIGITIDAGKGLFIPVVKSAQADSIESVADVLMEYRMNAFQGEFKAEQLTGGTISISLDTEQDVVTMIPIILPGQVAMISAGGVMSELSFDKDDRNKIVERKYMHMGIAYDHRVINGRDAMEFMGRIKQKLEQFDVTVYKK